MKHTSAIFTPLHLHSSLNIALISNLYSRIKTLFFFICYELCVSFISNVLLLIYLLVVSEPLIFLLQKEFFLHRRTTGFRVVFYIKKGLIQKVFFIYIKYPYSPKSVLETILPCFLISYSKAFIICFISTHLESAAAIKPEFTAIFFILPPAISNLFER